MRLNSKARRHRQVDRCPIRNIDSGVHVGNGDVATLETLEVRLRFPVPFITKATLTAGARCVAWVNHAHNHTCHHCLVADMLPQLPKGPIAVATTLLVPNRCSLSNVPKLFERECLALFRRLGNQPFY